MDYQEVLDSLDRLGDECLKRYKVHKSKWWWSELGSNEEAFHFTQMNHWERQRRRIREAKEHVVFGFAHNVNYAQSKEFTR